MDNEKLHDCGCEDESCGCGCGCHDHDHESLIVELEDENGNVVPCEVVDGFEYKDNEYALVQNPEDGSVYLFKVIGEDEDGELVVPEDDEFKEATAYYESLLENEE
ncbi:DUF1292 domain-containing protein [Clostridium thermopalmarium]|uniref:DUF1292 domain-containing protein n=1 Tax=Clostridium thermopalmarium DSM 5974 TaxID=1121340 RepID=A0A2T0AX63_9CLOT|nr:DUF1292 domain-containing protein [Clostridium thermopalmarium]PRR75401.1 hypothetical protein CPAL_05900 [Clostridium thermopalmarium DSM 5974]PVZ24303.1 uncharacterized protein DUF1292 [Clostridium thermopalmarium DSM 5974]